MQRRRAVRMGVGKHCIVGSRNMSAKVNNYSRKQHNLTHFMVVKYGGGIRQCEFKVRVAEMSYRRAVLGITIIDGLRN